MSMLSALHGAEQVFLLTVAPLVAFYVGFALFLFPSADLLHPHGLFAALAPSVPIGLHGLLKARALNPAQSPEP